MPVLSHENRVNHTPCQASTKLVCLEDNRPAGRRRVPWSRVCPTWRRTRRPGSEEPSAGKHSSHFPSHPSVIPLSIITGQIVQRLVPSEGWRAGPSCPPRCQRSPAWSRAGRRRSGPSLPCLLTRWARSLECRPLARTWWVRGNLDQVGESARLLMGNIRCAHWSSYHSLATSWPHRRLRCLPTSWRASRPKWTHGPRNLSDAQGGRSDFIKQRISLQQQIKRETIHSRRIKTNGVDEIPCCTFPASEEDLVVALQPLGHVVGVEDGHFGGMDQTSGTHHLHQRTDITAQSMCC